MIAKDYGEELEEIEDSLEGARLGYLMRAEDAKEYGLWEADHVFLHMDGGNVYSYTHIPNTIAYVRDEDYHLRGAMAVDQNAEMATLDEAVNQILGW